MGHGSEDKSLDEQGFLKDYGFWQDSTTFLLLI